MRLTILKPHHLTQRVHNLPVEVVGEPSALRLRQGVIGVLVGTRQPPLNTCFDGAAEDAVGVKTGSDFTWH